MQRSTPKVRYAVVGQGYIAQSAVLPAFAHARKNSELVALVTEDDTKAEALARKYGGPRAFGYEAFEDCLHEVDAAYIALPNGLHAGYAERAAAAGVHVLCEKPMAVTSAECERMIAAAAQSGVKLMIGYRLHFEEANLRAIEIAQDGTLGEVRVFESTFTTQVAPGNVRLDAELGGGTLQDIGIYCINAARAIFRAEPTAVLAVETTGRDPRFGEVAEMTSAILRFPGDRIATFTCSFGAAPMSHYRIIGTEGDLLVCPAFEHDTALEHRLTIGGRTRRRSFARRDQFAAELLYFSSCVLEDQTPEPSGREGLADVRVIEALVESAATGRSVAVAPVGAMTRPSLAQEIHRPPVREPKLVHAQSPSGQ